jgi:hypothetical protein
MILKKLDRGGISLPHRHYLKKSQNQRSRSRKPPNSGLPSLTGRCQLSTLQQPPRPEGGEQDTATRELEDIARGFFLTQAQKFASSENRTRDLRGATWSPQPLS